jgi:TolB protein
MINFWNNLSFALAVILPVSGMVAAAQSLNGQNGIFAGSTDIGKTLKGSTVYDAVSASYRVTGGGADMWGSEDAFHMSWVKLSGDAVLTADVQFPANVSVPLEKAVLIFRQSLDPASAYADLAIHGDGHTTIQYRLVAGGVTGDATAPQHAPTRLRIERKGNLFIASTGSADGKLTAFASQTVVMDGPVYVGIGFCAHNADGLASATFSNVKIEQTAR